MSEFVAITTFFNPAKFESLRKNYFIFADNLKRQGVDLITVECAFNDDEFQLPDGENMHRVRSNSIMWQKERLINYGISKLPPDCKYFGWLDCDVIFSVDNWVELAVQKLQDSEIVQLYKRVSYMPKGHTEWRGEKICMLQSVIWQKIIHKNWLNRRRTKELPFSTPGFAWSARKETFADIGIYDRNIIGSGDTFLVDCYLESWDIHGYAEKFTEGMKKDMMEWKALLDEKKVNVDFIPIDIYHLWHGSLKNRKYMDRHDIVLKYDYDPAKDIVLADNGVFEWASDKVGMHEDIKGYFHQRQEDNL
jgi:predicted glycosyltransferase involved in capsule biosynthesis